jgi:hypothetical protein
MYSVLGEGAVDWSARLGAVLCRAKRVDDSLRRWTDASLVIVSLCRLKQCPCFCGRPRFLSHGTLSRLMWTGVILVLGAVLLSCDKETDGR